MIKQKMSLYDFRGLPLKNHIDQKSSLEWLALAHSEAEARTFAHIAPQEKDSKRQRVRKLVLRLGRSNDRIRFRYSALDDFTHTEWEKMRIFNLNSHLTGAGCTERSLFYSEVVQKVFERFYEEEKSPPATLIHVTCTGYVAPSGAQLLIANKDWGRETEVLHAYHMGCYASLPALRMAMGPLYSTEGRVDIVHTELCSLHLDPTQHSLEQLVIQSLFSDGVIRYSVSRSDSCPLSPVSALAVVALREEIMPHTEKEMTWLAADRGMQMGLSREVPDRIAGGIYPFLERLAYDSGLSLSTLQERALFAVHPGGPKIIDQVQQLLGISSAQVEASNRILGSFGNMSSATLPYILKDILEDTNVSPGTWITALAFGPGLTISGAIFQKMPQK